MAFWLLRSRGCVAGNGAPKKVLLALFWGALCSANYLAPFDKTKDTYHHHRTLAFLSVLHLVVFYCEQCNCYAISMYFCDASHERNKLQGRGCGYKCMRFYSHHNSFLMMGGVPHFLSNTCTSGCLLF